MRRRAVEHPHGHTHASVAELPDLSHPAERAWRYLTYAGVLVSIVLLATSVHTRLYPLQQSVTEEEFRAMQRAAGGAVHEPAPGDGADIHSAVAESAGTSERGATSAHRADGRADEAHDAAGGRPAWKERRVWCVRHGEAEHNARKNNQLRDPLLTARGKEQAVRGRAAARDAAVDVVLVSPLKRALETALIMFADSLAAGVPLELDERVQEAWNVPADTGVPPTALQAFLDAHYGEFHVSTAALRADWFEKQGANAGGEAQVRARVRAFVQALAARSEERVAVVCHHAVLKRMTGVEFANGEMREFRLAQGGEGGEGEFVLVPVAEDDPAAQL